MITSFQDFYTSTFMHVSKFLIPPSVLLYSFNYQTLFFVFLFNLINCSLPPMSTKQLEDFKSQLLLPTYFEGRYGELVRNFLNEDFFHRLKSKEEYISSLDLLKANVRLTVSGLMYSQSKHYSIKSDSVSILLFLLKDFERLAIISKDSPFFGAVNLDDKYKVIDTQISNMLFSEGFASILANSYLFVADKIIEPINKNYITSLIMMDFVSLISPYYVTYIPVNLSSYKGSLETLNSLARTIQYYHRTIKNEDYMQHSLVCGQEIILEYMKYGLKQVMPNTYFNLIDILPGKSGFSSNVNQALKGKLMQRLDDTQAHDFYIFGHIIYFLKVLHNSTSHFLSILTYRGKEFNFLNLKNYTKREITKHHESISNLYETNDILSKLDINDDNMALVGYTGHLNLDDAIISRFPHYIEEDDNFQCFVNYCKSVYLDYTLEYGAKPFPSSKIDLVIYSLASKFFNVKNKHERIYSLIPRLFALSARYPSLTFDNFLKYL